MQEGKLKKSSSQKKREKKQRKMQEALLQEEERRKRQEEKRSEQMAIRLMIGSAVIGAIIALIIGIIVKAPIIWLIAYIFAGAAGGFEILIAVALIMSLIDAKRNK